MNDEDCKPIPGYSRYAVSRGGQVYVNKGTPTSPQHRPLKMSLVKHGYVIVNIRNDDGVYKRVYVHRLVLLAHVGPPLDGFEACHNNGNRADNRLENLRWDSRSANNMDKVAHGTATRGEKSSSAKLTREQVLDIRSHKRRRHVCEELAAKYGVSVFTVCNIRRKKPGEWKWLTHETA